MELQWEPAALPLQVLVGSSGGDTTGHPAGCWGLELAFESLKELTLQDCVRCPSKVRGNRTGTWGWMEKNPDTEVSEKE